MTAEHTGGASELEGALAELLNITTVEKAVERASRVVDGTVETAQLDADELATIVRDTKVDEEPELSPTLFDEDSALELVDEIARTYETAEDDWSSEEFDTISDVDVDPSDD